MVFCRLRRESRGAPHLYICFKVYDHLVVSVDMLDSYLVNANIRMRTIQLQ